MLEQIRSMRIGVSAVAATPFAMGAALAAEEAKLPFVSLVLQPFMTLSALDPPSRPWTGLKPAQPGTAQHSWNKAVLGTVRWLFRRSLGGPHRALRAELGLPPHPGTPLFDPDGAPALSLGLWDTRYCPQPTDSGTTPVGFPPPAQGHLDLAHMRWLEQDQPPLVITLGSIAQNLGGAAFWEEAVSLARAMGLRAVLLHGQADVPEGPDLLALPYAPHTALFPKAAAILHHGGIGTSAEALRSGRPQLVIPVGGDQPDNAARLEALGVATTLPLRRFTAKRAHALLAPLLDRFDYPAAGALADQIRSTDGAMEAANRISDLLEPPPQDKTQAAAETA
jgi:UDP:flavonoid glycosyltransferase YjiC (YdhE family)